MKKYIALSMVSLMLLNACATIISGETDKVAFTAVPENATFLIKNEAGQSVHEGKTPATVMLDRGNGYFAGQTYQVEFSAQDYISQTQKLDTSMNGWYLGNLIFGGLIGFLVVDPATGAMWDLPEKMDVKLTTRISN
ncbi:MAG: hypothetical protein IPN42_08920 [Methylococcaceae bacterium]|nr:hypothetical protein [Methylococcaceae bacterium]